ncbi:MAG: hypothetical protein KDC38_01560 [Planctomycetes bacterium]|nr:hypothetical protein [Planctomycetota bacterium]
MTWGRSRILAAAVLAVIALSTGCSTGSDRVPGERLPFHVALLPAKLVDRSALDKALGSEGNDFRVHFEQQWFDRTLARELQDTAFVRVTPIALAADLIDEQARDRAAIEQADFADLIIQPILHYDSRVTFGSNERFFESLRLSLTWPVFSWYVKDWDYSFNGQPVQLTARSYFGDTAEAPLRFSTRVDQKVLEDDAQVEADDPALSFVERTGDGWGSYALAIFLPSTLLEGDRDTTAAAVKEEVLVDLARRLAIELAREARLFQNPDKANVWLLTSSPSVHELDERTVELSMPVTVCDASLPGLHSYRIDGGERIRIPEDQRELFELTFVAERERGTARVEIFDARDRRRSFTFALVPPEEREDAGAE